METRVDPPRHVPTSDLIDAILNACPVGFVLLDERRSVRAANDEARRMLGLATDVEMTGQAWDAFARPAQPGPDPLGAAYAGQPVRAMYETTRGGARFGLRAAGGRGSPLALYLTDADSDDERRRWLERALKELPTAIYIVDPDKDVLIYQNNLMQAFAGEHLVVGATGAERVQILGIRDAATGKKLERHQYPSARAARGEVIRDYPMTWITARGVRDVTVTAHLVPGGGRDITSGRGVVIVSVTDQTKLKDVQRRLEESEARLRVALVSADVGTWHVDLRSGVVTVSPSTAQIFDYETNVAPLAEVIDRRVHPDDVARVRERWSVAMAAGEAYVDEYRVLRRDGSVRWVFSRGRGLAGEGDQPASISGVLADITETKLAEMDLNLERQKMTAVFDESPAAIALWRGADLIFEKANSRFCAMFAKRDLVGHSIAEALPDLASQPFFAAPARVFADGQSVVAHEAPTYTDPAGEVHFVDYAFVRINDPDGQPYGVFGHAADVTDRVRAREQLERAKVAAEIANQAKSAFLANISHEIRTPLGAILGFAELAEDEALTAAERSQYLQTITRNGRALTRIIDDLLDLAKVEAGQLNIETIETSLAEVLNEVTDLFSEAARAKQLVVETSIADDVPDPLWSDPTRLRQIFINVVGNAIKFTERGRVAIEARAGRAPGPATVEVRVRDTGIGLSVAQRERLFRPFAQADESTTRRFGGTGLGLALARRLAAALGGDVIVESSEPGRGSVFRVTFRAGSSSRL